jgi:hypothetical protein
MRILSLSGFFFLLAPLVPAQNGASGPVSAALNAWQARYGPQWSVKTDPVTGLAEMIYGGRAAGPGRPVNDEQWIAQAQSLLRATAELHGIDVATLVPEAARLLPLGMVGSTDKWAVSWRQEIAGIPVHGGRASVLLDARGGLLSIQIQALAGLEQLVLTPAFEADAARDQAVLGFEKKSGEPAAFVSVPRLVILPVEEGPRRVGHLCWEIEVQSAPRGGDPSGVRSWIDARYGFPLRSEPSVHFFDISGTVSTMATPGTQSDTVTNPETPQPAKYLRIQHSTGTVYTDANGNFNIPGALAPQNVILSYVGLYGDASDQPTGTHYSLSVPLVPGPGNLVLLNPTSVDTVTSQANAFNVVSTVRDYVRRVNPLDAHADHLFPSNCNINAACNAYYNGSSLNFYAAGTTTGGTTCNNTAFSTVAAHEQGHWLNDDYNTGNGGDGMGEGNADVWALYVYDTPLNGSGFFASGGAVRTGLNTRQFCGDCTPACYGEVHADGEPWMGAAWKVRANLNTTLGNTLGDQVADQIFLGWMNGYDQTQIRSVIELQWLILDDNDANLANGTPHATDIMNGFRVQGFPGYFMEIPSFTSWTDQTCELGSYPVTATVQAVQATTVASVLLRYRLNGGAWNDVSMQPVGGNDWSASIPYVASPVRVEYTVVATDSGAHTKSASCAPREFFVGQFNSFVYEDFEGPSPWTTGFVGDTSNNNNDWQRATPQGRSGTSQSVSWTDPASAGAGAACWGNDLGLSTPGAGNGSYQNNVHNFLRSPAYNCTGQTGVNLSFKRWLTVEESQFDVARVLVNDIEVWRNPASGHLVDTTWTIQIIDISALADNNPSVTLQFELKSDGGLALGGWQIDELRLGGSGAAAQCSAIQSFCAGDGSLPRTARAATSARSDTAARTPSTARARCSAPAET